MVSMQQTILIADPSLFMRLTMRKILAQLDMQVVAETHRGDEAIALYGEVRPALAFLDVSLPGKDGVSAAREILAMHPEARIVLLSALGKAEGARSAQDWGVAGVLPKPFHPEMVQKAAIHALAKRD